MYLEIGEVPSSSLPRARRRRRRRRSRASAPHLRAEAAPATAKNGRSGSRMAARTRRRFRRDGEAAGSGEVMSSRGGSSRDSVHASSALSACCARLGGRSQSAKLSACSRTCDGRWAAACTPPAAQQQRRSRGGLAWASSRGGGIARLVAPAVRALEDSLCDARRAARLAPRHRLPRERRGGRAAGRGGGRYAAGGVGCWVRVRGGKQRTWLSRSSRAAGVV